MMILSDYLNGVIDNRGRNPDRYFEKEKYPVIDNFLIKNELHPNILQATRYINEQTYQNFLRGYVYPNMVIMTLVGNGIGNVTTISDVNSVIIQNTIGFDVKKDLLSDLFLFYFFRYKLDAIKQFDRGSGQPSIKKTDLLCMEVNFPALKIQEKIASILSSLDDKIELNQRQNNNLEQQAQALFKSWFVDFEPFGGVMPEDWKIGVVDDIIELFDAQRIPLSSNQRENMEKIYPYYGATSLMDYVDNYIFDGKYLLLGEDGTVIDDKGFPILQYVWGKFWVNNHAHILQGKNGFNVESLYLFFKNKNIKGIVTGAVQPKINQANLRALPATIPSKTIMDKFNYTIKPLFDLIRKNREENIRLSAIRDTLLPKLMSGEIDVSNVDISALTSTDKLSFSEKE